MTARATMIMMAASHCSLSISRSRQRSSVQLPTMLLLLVLRLAANTDAFLGSFWEANNAHTRHFTQEGLLPPLLTFVQPHVSSTSTKSAILFGYNNTLMDCSIESTAIGDDDVNTMNSLHGGVVPVTYTNDPTVVDEWLCKNLPYDGSIIGFDVERVPRLRNARNQDLLSFSRGATVQLATPTSCLVVHLVRPNGRHSNMCAPILKSVLVDKTYVKAGCALDDDLVGLYELWGNLDAKSRFDLGTVVPCTNGTGKHRGRNRSGLQSLSKSILGVNLPKDRGDTLSDWSDVPLSDARIVYAARDAWAGAAIANKLAEYDPECFSREALVNLFQQTETPISNLVKRRRKRKRAKEHLEVLLHPYKDETSNRLPRQVQQKADRLRELINTRVMDHHVIFETSYLEDDA